MSTTYRKYRLPILFFVLAILILVPRLPALDRFVTVDEPTWIMRAANFYYALSQREFDQTVYAYHPAVTTMWVSAAGVLQSFPEYRGQGQGYFVKEWKFAEFVESFNRTALEILSISRLINVLINTALLLLIFVLMARLIGAVLAFVTTLFVSFEPFFLGHTRILAHEGMMSLLLVASILAYLVFQTRSRKWRYLVLSAICAALAILTKSSATLIIPFVGLLFLVETLIELAQNRAGPESDRIGVGASPAAGNWGLRRISTADIFPAARTKIVQYGLWLLVLGLMFFLAWPGMWVDPLEMLYQVYGNAFSYVFRGYNLEAVDVAETVDALGFATSSGFVQYAVQTLWKTTAVWWLGLLAGLTGIVFFRARIPVMMQRLLAYFLLFSLLFYVMMSMAGGRKSSHYLMSSIVAVDIVAALGLLSVYYWFGGSGRAARWKFAVGMILTVLLIFQSWSALQYYPYYFDYTNALLRPFESRDFSPGVGYGEGLELAAEYLAQKQGAENDTALVWYGVGSFSYFYPGHTINLAPESGWGPSAIERMLQSDYLVLYYEHQLRRNMPVKLLADIEAVTPEHTIRIHEIEYIRIYPVDTLPDEIFIPDLSESPEE